MVTVKKKRKRILIFHASIGSGHEVAAKALRCAIRQHYPDVAVLVVDALFPVKGRNEWLTSLGSSITMNFLPGLYDRVWRTGEFQRAYQRICRLPCFQSHIGEAVRSWQPDLVVCTHSLPASVLAWWQKDHPHPIPTIAVATDYQVHPYWPFEDITQFIVPSELTKQKLAAEGVAAETIFPYGIPLRSEIGQSEDASGNGAGNGAANGSDEGAKSVLVVAGGSRAATYGSLQPKITGIWHYLNQMPSLPYRWTFVVGNNDKLKEDLQRTNLHPDQLRVHGFVPDLPKLMQTAQIVVAKPGGLITAETLALGKPLVCLVSGSGQERANVGFLLSTGTGILSEDPAEAVEIVNALLADDQERASYQQRAAQWGRPNATEQITEHLVGLLGIEAPSPDMA